MTQIVIFSGARTAIGGFGGSLSGFAPHELASIVAKEAIKRAKISPNDVGLSVFGHVINTEPKDMYLSRLAAMNAGVPAQAPAMNVNRLCGSGLQALVSAAQALQTGEADFALVGGAETMSRAPYTVPAARFGQKMGDSAMIDMLVGTLTCPFGTGHMGVTAENIAREYDISRQAQDELALISQQRAAHAQQHGHFSDQIVPVVIKGRKGDIVFDQDEHLKSTTYEALAGLRAAFSKDGSVTAGNASGINDGAAAVIIARADAASAANLSPCAKILATSIAGVPPEVMGIGPIPAVEKIFKKTGLTAADFDVIESNEAFAAQALAVSRALNLDSARVNPNGGAIALGHPVGATGVILLVKAMAELKRINKKRGLVTMCIGGGQGIAVAFEML